MARAQPDDRVAADLRGFGPVGIVAILVILLAGIVSPGHVAVPLGGILTLLWVRLSHTSWRQIGYVRPRSWIGDLVVGFVFGVVFKFAMKALVMPLLDADPVNATYHYLAENRALLPAAVWTMVVAGFGEETVFRGFLFERFGKLLGSGAGAKLATVLITTGLFALAHDSDQGLAGVEQAVVTGLAFGSIFAARGRIWMLMSAHAAFDLAAVAMIYWNIESDVAHLVFK